MQSTDLKDMRNERANGHGIKRNLFLRLNTWLVILAIAGLGVGIPALVLTYLALKQPEPGVLIETISDTNVLDLRRPLQDLSINFRGQDVQEQNLNLKIITINVLNNGEVDILINHYDYEDDWGIKFENGEVIEARLIDTNSDYLRSKIVPQRMGTDTVVFPKVIFEKGKSFAVEVLLLHSKNKSPSISPVGKIAGIDTISVLTRPLTRQEVSIFKEIFRGSIPVHTLRFLIYQAGFLAIFGIAVIGLSLCHGDRDVANEERKTRILDTQTIHKIDEEGIRNFLISHYESKGISGLKHMQMLIKNSEGLEAIMQEEQLDPSATRAFDMKILSLVYSNTLNDLAKIGVTKKGQDSKIIVSPMFSEALDDLVSELEG